MTLKRFARLAAALSCAIAVAACGNTGTDSAKLVKALPGVLFPKKTTPPAMTQDQITKALAATGASMSLYQSERTKSQFLMLDIQRNGPYQSYGNSSRQVIVMRSGMMMSTRGIGGDLMSTDEDALYALLRNRREGNAPYVMRWLTPEDVTEAHTFQCAVARAGNAPVALGEINSSGTILTAKCQSPEHSFTNTYIVEKSGYILSARQWLGPVIDYMGVQALRR